MPFHLSQGTFTTKNTKDTNDRFRKRSQLAGEVLLDAVRLFIGDSYHEEHEGHEEKNGIR